MREYNFEFLQGDTLAEEIIYRNEDGTLVDLTGCSAHMQLRVAPASSVVVLDLSTVNQRITVFPEGRIVLFVDAVEMAEVPAGDGRYDLEVTFPTGVVKKILRGGYSIIAEVTR